MTIFGTKIGVFAFFWHFLALNFFSEALSASAQDCNIVEPCLALLSRGQMWKLDEKFRRNWRFLSNFSIFDFESLPFSLIFFKVTLTGGNPCPNFFLAFSFSMFASILVPQVLWKGFSQMINLHCVHWSKFCTDSEDFAGNPFWCWKQIEAYCMPFQGASCSLGSFWAKNPEKWSFFLSLSHVLFGKVVRSFKKLGYVSIVVIWYQVHQNGIKLGHQPWLTTKSWIRTMFEF